MSYKSELQANNADLQTIITTVDNLPNPVNVDSELDTQANLLSQIQTALNGKGINKLGGLTLDNIGIFTLKEAEDFQFLFVKGMTFGEWADSNMNVPFLFANGDWYFVKTYAKIEICNTPNPYGAYGSVGYLATDGTDEGTVKLDTVIQEIEYQIYSEEL